MTSEILMFSEMDPVYTVPDVAQYLRCSRRHVWNLLRRGDLACLKLGGLTRVTARQLDVFLTAHRADCDER